MLSEAMMMNANSPTAASLPDAPAWAKLAPAAKESARFFGFRPLSSAPRPPALTGVSESIDAIHLGCACASGLFCARSFLTARRTSHTPSSSLIQDTVSEVVSSVDASLASERRYTATLTTATPSTQPARKAGPLTRARAENSTRITAMMGSGLMATPMAYGSTTPIASPTVVPLAPVQQHGQ